MIASASSASASARVRSDVMRAILLLLFGRVVCRRGNRSQGRPHGVRRAALDVLARRRRAVGRASLRADALRRALHPRGRGERAGARRRCCRRRSGSPIRPSTGTASTGRWWSGRCPRMPTRAASILAHESFHRVRGPSRFSIERDRRDGHLDALNGRVLLQLEWRALGAALRAPRDKRRQAHRRRARTSAPCAAREFPEAAKEEREREMNEGLAEYTGTALGRAGSVEARCEARHQSAARRRADADVRPLVRLCKQVRPTALCSKRPTVAGRGS